MTTAMSSGEMLKLEDAVRYPGAWRKSVLITVVVVVVIFAGALATPSVSPFFWAAAGVALMFGAVALARRKGHRLVAVATRICKDHPGYTPQQAANAARRELGLSEVRYP